MFKYSCLFIFGTDFSPMTFFLPIFAGNDVKNESEGVAGASEPGAVRAG